MPKNGSVFFTIFQSVMTETGNLEEPSFNYQDYPADFFDCIIIDECHRAGAKDGSEWRAIMEWFAPAVQIGLTATPRRSAILDGLSESQRGFLDFVLSQYVTEGEDELDLEKLPRLLDVKYGSSSEGLQALGASVREVQEAFRGFQGKLYSEESKQQ